MYRVVTFAFMMIFLGSIAGATTSLRTDGVWWAALSDSQRVVAVQAISDSYPTAYGIGYTAGGLNNLNAFTGAMRTAHLTDAEQLRVATLFAKLAAQHTRDTTRPQFRKTFGAYVDGITYFYSSHPTAAELPVSYMLSCVQDNAVLTCDSIAADYEKHMR